MAEIAIWAAEKLVEYAIDPILKQFKYLFCYGKIIQNLRDELGTLERQQAGVQLLVDAARRNADIIDENVLSWLGNVENIKKEAHDVLNIPVNSETKCLCINPNLKFRYWQSRKATKITTAIVEFQKKGVLPTVSYPTPPEQMSIHMIRDTEGLDTRISKRNEIVEALKDENTHIIGICGMAGVGKTTMAHEIANEVKQFFYEVVIVTVSKDPDTKKIQDQIVEALGKRIQENNNEGVRAGRVKERLTYDVHGKILIILDDVWEEVELQKIGIPQKGDHKGLKILLTTRRKEVCDIMEADRIYEVKVLPENEALKLLKHAAKISDDTSEVVKGLAAQVAKKCDGLPLSLVIIGKTLINKEEFVWRDVLQQLENSKVTNIKGVHERVFEVIGYSYNNLKSEDVKSLFLLCSLFPEDYNIPIETLVRYARGQDMFKDTATLFHMRNRISSIISDLKDSYLLLSGEIEDTVKLHDVVREFCLLIASQGKHVYMAKHNDLKEWPEHVDDNSHIAISLKFDDGRVELPSGLEYPNLKLLRLESEGELWLDSTELWLDSTEMIISNDFFSNMNQLRVLQLKNFQLNQISLSPQSLTNLQTLCLEYCVFDTEISAIGNLKKLEILSFFKSDVYNFPIEIAQLNNLKLLDLRFRRCLQPLPRGVLSSLRRLEELYLGAHFVPRSYDNNKVEKHYMYIIEELSSLNGLETFQIWTYDPEFLLELLRRMSLENLQRFQIICTKDLPDANYHCGRSLHLDGFTESMMRQSIIHDSLLLRTENLTLDHCGPLKNFVNEVREGSFVNLKTLILLSCDVEYLIDTTELNPRSTFNNLEQLHLQDLFDLKGVCNGNLPPGAFARLQEVHLIDLPIQHLWSGVIKPPSLCNVRVMHVSNCGKIKSIFSESAAKCLLNLEILEITNSDMLEHIVSRDDAQNEATDQVLEFKKLQCLELTGLTSLKSFISQSNADTKTLTNQVKLPNLEKLYVSQLNTVATILNDKIQPKALYKLRELDVSDCHDIMTILQSDTVNVIQNLESLKVSSCETLRVLLSLEGLKVIKEETQSILHRLRSLQLFFLPKLEHIARNVPQGICIFRNLTTLDVHFCDSLRYLFSPSMASSLLGLETLSVTRCETIETIVKREEEEETEESAFTDNKGGELCKLVFPKLSTLELTLLPSLTMFCSEKIELVFPSLHRMGIFLCNEMVKFCSQEPIAPKLKKIEVGSGKSVDFSNVLGPES